MKFDLKRMEKAMASPKITVPFGLSREGIRNFIISNAKKPLTAEYTKV